jgi:hypothetical protein
MVDGHMLLEREFVKQSTLIDLSLTHHHLHSSFDNWSESLNQPRRNLRLFQQNPIALRTLSCSLRLAAHSQERSCGASPGAL